MKKIIARIALGLLGFLMICFLFFWIKSPGKLSPLKDEKGKLIPNSISEKNKTEIGGIPQGFFIRSENPENPVILYLHGGPGSPELPLTIPHECSERLEKYFTVCYWDQRGAGITYSSSLDPSTATVKQMVEDTYEITQYLKKRFKKEKIYIMGHSWGSYLGIKTIEKYPEEYWAYIGIGQVTNQLESEKLAYDYMLQHALEIKDQKAVSNLSMFDKNASDFPSPDYMFKARTSLMNKYGIGIMHQHFSMLNLYKDVLFFNGYTLADKIRYVKGNIFSLKYIFYRVIEDNLFESSLSFTIPIYITHGKFDYQVSHTLALQYMNAIEAPEKEFFTFDNSAHSPNMEEPEKFVHIIKEIAGRNPAAK